MTYFRLFLSGNSKGSGGPQLSLVSTSKLKWRLSARVVKHNSVHMSAAQVNQILFVTSKRGFEEGAADRG